MHTFIKNIAMIIQQPSELPQPKPSPPDQQFGQYTLEYFIQDNLLYLLGIVFIVLVVFGYFWYVRNKRKEGEVEN